MKIRFLSQNKPYFSIVLTLVVKGQPTNETLFTLFKDDFHISNLHPLPQNLFPKFLNNGCCTLLNYYLIFISQIFHFFM